MVNLDPVTQINTQQLGKVVVQHALQLVVILSTQHFLVDAI